MAVKVFHSEDMWGFRGDKRENWAAWPAEFHHVATLDIDDAAALTGKAFELTNTIDHHWWKNGGVTAHFESEAFCEVNCKKGTRSTSVGDAIMLSDGRLFKCDSIGWKEVVV